MGSEGLALNKKGARTLPPMDYVPSNTDRLRIGLPLYLRPEADSVKRISYFFDKSLIRLMISEALTCHAH